MDVDQATDEEGIQRHKFQFNSHNLLANGHQLKQGLGPYLFWPLQRWQEPEANDNIDGEQIVVDSGEEGTVATTVAADSDTGSGLTDQLSGLKLEPSPAPPAPTLPPKHPSRSAGPESAAPEEEGAINWVSGFYFPKKIRKLFLF